MGSINGATEGKSIVGDDEIVLRAVRNESGEYTIRDGTLRVSSSAFNDRERKPSVDREAVRGSPELARKSATDGVISLITGDVRSINVTTNDAKGRPVHEHSVDVTHNPLANNLSHCLIICVPALQNDTIFRKLKEALARLAEQRGWRVPPASST